MFDGLSKIGELDKLADAERELEKKLHRHTRPNLRPHTAHSARLCTLTARSTGRQGPSEHSE